MGGGLEDWSSQRQSESEERGREGFTGTGLNCDIGLAVWRHVIVEERFHGGGDSEQQYNSVRLVPRLLRLVLLPALTSLD